MSTPLPYTIAFCIAGDKVLMLKRAKPPNQHLWNGIGGKIEPGESPDEGVAREIMEEAELDIKDATHVYFAGTVTWTVVEDESNKNKGMAAFLIEFPPNFVFPPRDTPEGVLEWKDLSWVTDKTNTEVVKNITHFLPLMLKKGPPVNYHCEYLGSDFDHITIRPM